MFEKIEGPQNPYAGPAQGLATDQGDSWHTAVQKINNGFKNVIKAIEGGVERVFEMVDTDARKEIAELRETLAALQIKLDAVLEAQKTPAPVVLTEEKQPEPVVKDPDGNPPSNEAPVAPKAPAAPLADFSGLEAGKTA